MVKIHRVNSSGYSGLLHSSVNIVSHSQEVGTRNLKNECLVNLKLRKFTNEENNKTKQRKTKRKITNISFTQPHRNKMEVLMLRD